MAVYACSDLHGMITLYHAIKKFIKLEDTVYFLGDAGDRGIRSWDTIKTILDDSQFIYLKGNHEDMLIDAYETYDPDNPEGLRPQWVLWRNGGRETLEEALADPNGVKIIQKLKELPVRTTYENKNGEVCMMSHAGFTPYTKKKYRVQDLIWDREHFYDYWPENNENTIIVHGHTPIPFMEEEGIPEVPGREGPGAFWYCNSHKVCIDNGCFFTGKCILLNLDTFDEEIFEIPHFVYRP